MRKNPPSEGFEQIGRGSFSRAYAKGDNVEVITTKGFTPNTIDASKDLIIEARKICSDGAKRYLPFIRRSRIIHHKEESDQLGYYEFIYDMPLYTLAAKVHEFDFRDKPVYKLKSQMLNDLIDEISVFKHDAIHSKLAKMSDVINCLHNVWKEFSIKSAQNLNEVAYACEALRSIEKISLTDEYSKAVTDYKEVRLMIDINMYNTAVNTESEQMIWLDPIALSIPVKKLLKIWKSYGITPE